MRVRFAQIGETCTHVALAERKEGERGEAKKNGKIGKGKKGLFPTSPPPLSLFIFYSIVESVQKHASERNFQHHIFKGKWKREEQRGERGEDSSSFHVSSTIFRF